MQHGGDPGSLLCARCAVIDLVSKWVSLSRYHARRDMARSRGVAVVWSVAAPVYGCVKGRSMERDNMQLRSIVLNTTGYMHSSHQPPPWGSHLSNMLPAFLLLAYEQSLWDRTTLSVPI